VLHAEEKEVWSATTLLCVSFALCFALRLLPSNTPPPAAAAADDDDDDDDDDDEDDDDDVDTIDKCAWPAGPLNDLT